MQTWTSKQKKSFENDNEFLKKVDAEQKEKSYDKKEREPTIENVKAYFLEEDFPELEAVKQLVQFLVLML